MTKTSFAGVPGIVLLGSGGMFEFAEESEIGAGDAILQALIHPGQGNLSERGADYALKMLCRSSQDRSRQRSPDYDDDVSGILIRWAGQQSSSSASRQAASAAQSFQQLSHGEANRSQPRVVPVSEIQSKPMPNHQASGSTMGSRGMPEANAVRSWLGNPTQTSFSVERNASALEAKPQRPGATLAAMAASAPRAGLSRDPFAPVRDEASATSTPVADESGGPRKFLQAQPRGGRGTAAAPSQKAKVPLQLPQSAATSSSIQS